MDISEKCQLIMIKAGPVPK